VVDEVELFFFVLDEGVVGEVLVFGDVVVLVWVVEIVVFGWVDYGELIWFFGWLLVAVVVQDRRVVVGYWCFG